MFGGPPPKRQQTESSGSRFAECPVCGASVALFKINEHLDSCSGPAPCSSQPGAASASSSVSASSSLRTPALLQRNPSVGSAASASSSLRTPASTLLQCNPSSDSPIARAFGIVSTPSPTPDGPPPLSAEAAYMPGYVNRLHDCSYPGAGTAIHSDPRRRQSWLLERGPRAARAPGEALAAVAARAVLDAPAGVLSVGETAVAAELSGLEQTAAALAAHCFAGAGGWLRLRALPAPPLPTTTAPAAAPAADAAAAWEPALQRACSRGVLEALKAERPPPLPHLVAPLSTLSARALRALLQSLGLGAPTTDRRSPSPAAEGGVPPTSALLASHLIAQLGRRRQPDLSAVLAALGPCARMAVSTCEKLHALSVCFFCCAGYRPDEAAIMLRGDGGLTRDCRAGAAAAPRAALLQSRAQLLALQAALRLSDRAEAARAACDGAAVLAAHAEALAAVSAAGGEGSAPMLGALARVIGAGCGELRRTGRLAECVRSLSHAAQLSLLPRRWRANAVCQLVKDLQACGSKLAALRICEAAHAGGGRLSAEALRGALPAGGESGGGVGGAGGEEESPIVLLEEEVVEVVEEGQGQEGDAGALASIVLSRPQMVSVRRTLKKLAVAPRRWKKPQLPELLRAREVRIRAVEVRAAEEEARGASAKRSGWRPPTRATEHHPPRCPAQEEDSPAPASPRPVGVEELVRLTYLSGAEPPSSSSEGGARSPEPAWVRGEHLENSIFLSTFALLTWDACLFLPLDGAFSSTSADHPHELLQGGDAFEIRRRQAIDALVARLTSDDDEGPRLLRQAWDAHHGELCVGLDWESADLHLLQWAASAMGGRVLGAIVSALAHDYAGMCHGAPDLLLLSALPPPDAEPQAHPRARARFVEVKGPGDRLSDAQLVWIDLLATAGADVCVAYVVAEAE